MQVLQKIIICGNICLVIALWEDIFIVHIALNPIFTFFRQFYPGDFANFAGSIIIFFFIAALIIWWFCQIVTLPRWPWLLHLLRYFFIDNQTWWYLLSSSSSLQLFRPYFVVTNFMSFSFIETFTLSWEIVLGSSLNIYSQFNW